MRLGAIAVLSGVALALPATVAIAQRAGQTNAAPASVTPNTSPPLQNVAIPHAPRPRQVEPMVAPVRRVAPKTGPATVARPVPQTATAKSAPKPALAAPKPPTPAVVAQPVPSGAAATARATGQTVTPPAAGPKYVVHTCKWGQDYSEKLKACFTPGVTRVTSAVTSAKNGRGKATAKAQAKLEPGTRSALGARPKR